MAGENIVRQDIVQISFDVDNSGLADLTRSVDSMRNAITGATDDNGLNRLTARLNGTDDALSNAARSAQGLGGALGNAAESARNTQRSATRTHTSLKGLGKLALTQLNSGLDKVSGRLTEIGKKAAGAAYSGVKKLAGISFKTMTVGLTSAAVAVSALTTQAVNSYADYEQLVGGVKTLLGAKDTNSVEEYAKLVGKSVSEVQDEYDNLIGSQNAVIANANNAYKTAGLSANEYMETVTGFSASLLQSLEGDTQKAVEYADMAILDMADNANKMGSDMSSIQNAYQGFAKQNYTMLDNLKLGYGGTKEEMERLVADAAKLDKTIDATSLSYGNIVKAIHAVQVETGIYGTTQKEAEHTITGSLNSMRSAWNNLLPAMIEGGDSFDQCVDNLVSSVGVFSGNIMPAVEKALGGVGSLITKLTPLIVKEIPKIAQDLLPPLINSAISITQGLIDALPGILNVLIAQLPTLIKSLLPAMASGTVQLIKGVVQVVKTNSPTLVSAAKEAIAEIIRAVYEGFTGKTMSTTMFSDLKISIESVFNKIQQAIGVVIQFGQSMWNSLAPIFSTVGSLALSIFSGIANNMNAILPIVKGLTIAFIAFKAVMLVVNAISAVHGAVTAVMAAHQAMAAGATVAATAAQNGNNATILAGIALKVKESAAWVASKAALVATTVATKAAAVGQMLLNGTLLACPLTWIVIAIMALVGVFVVLYQKCEWVRNAFNAIGDAIKWVGEKISSFFGWIGEKLGFTSKEAGKTGGESLKEGFDEGSAGIDAQAFNLGTTAGTSLDSGFANGIDMSAYMPTDSAGAMVNQTDLTLSGITDTSQYGIDLNANLASGIDMSAYMPVSAAADTETLTDSELQKLVSSTPQYGTDAMTGLASGISAASYAPTTAAVGVAADTQSALYGVSANTSQIGAQAATGFSSGFTNGSGSVTEAMGDMQNTVSDTMSIVTTDISDGSLKAAEAMNLNMTELAAVTKTKLDEAVTAVKNAMNSIKAAVSGCNLKNSGANIADGLIEGINSRRSALAAAAQSMASTVTNSVNSALDIHSPSRVLFETGVNTVQGDINGIKSKLPEVGAAAQKMGDMSIPYGQTYTPQNSSVSNTSRSYTSERNTYSPQFNATFYTNGTDRDIKSKFKRWFDEAMSDFFESADRRNPQTTEV